MAGLAYAGQHSDVGHSARGSLDVRSYGRVLKARQLVGVRGAGLPFDGLYYVKSVTHDIERGATSRASTLTRNGAGLDRADGADMSDSTAFFGNYRGTVVNNIDPMQIGRIQAIVPDVAGVAPTTWAMPCLPMAGHQTRACSPCRRSAPAVWIEFEHGDPDYPIWTGGFWGSAAEVPALALAMPPGVHRIMLQTPLQNSS